jgi:hypothetical protein
MEGVEPRTAEEWAETITYRVCEALWGAGGLLPEDERYQAIHKQVLGGVKLIKQEVREQVLEPAEN